MNSKVTIGSEEWISLSDLNIPHIKARVDSGAKTSSLHALNIQPYQKEGQT
jgi:ribosomal protein S6--L-glutamate ligase